MVLSLSSKKEIIKREVFKTRGGVRLHACVKWLNKLT